MDKNKNGNENLFIASLLAILFVLFAAVAVWVTQVSPSVAKLAALEPNTGDTTSAQAKEAPAQISGGDAAAGQKLFASTCAACHGPTGEGIQGGLGKDMTSSQFIAGKTDDELVSFIKVGRDPSDPLNTTGVGMPAKGGNPALKDKDLFDIVAHIRTIQK